MQEPILASQKDEKTITLNNTDENIWRDSSTNNVVAYEDLIKEALNCSRCRLSETRLHVVFGVGQISSPQVAFVGEGPGAEEDKKGVPFVGRAGELLIAAITKGMGLKREDVYICNVIKCRPPDNRTPLPDEVEACYHFLHKQLLLVKPRIIITLGQPAQKALCNIDIGITKLRGQWQSWQGIKLMPTYHPAYILRNPSAKRPFWEDLQEVMRELGLKQ
ncbi:MAG: uracil-DNA glycosylase [Deltaproteobacteria bacterium]|nr:uracil-DNA glycosylase [Deltaproteobacteria bacterium]